MDIRTIVTLIVALLIGLKGLLRSKGYDMQLKYVVLLPLWAFCIVAYVGPTSWPFYIGRYIWRLYKGRNRKGQKRWFGRFQRQGQKAPKQTKIFVPRGEAALLVKAGKLVAKDDFLEIYSLNDQLIVVVKKTPPSGVRSLAMEPNLRRPQRNGYAYPAYEEEYHGYQ
jgi:hypothetical protein